MTAVRAAGTRWATFRAACAVELLKARRSRLPALTAGVVMVAAAVEALFMVIAADPDRARALGLLAQKAELSGVEPTWPGLLGFTAQILAVGGLLIFSFVVTWVFGREFADGTAHYLMALPVSRATVVGAKLALATCWCAALAVVLVGLSLGVGALLGLPDGEPAAVTSGVGHSLLAAALMIPAVLPVAVVASAARGYLAPLATALGLLATAQVGAVLGWAGVIPWAVPAVAAGLVPGQGLTPVAVGLTLAAGAAGAVGTASWWRSGDAGR
jgi:ABC-2 type transport system permease protein